MAGTIEELAAATREGDAAALSALFAALYDELHRMGRREVGLPGGGLTLVLFFLSTSAAFDAEREFKVFELFDRTFLFIMLVAYAFVGIQSLIYSFVMEFVVNPKIANNFTAVLASMVIGAISGVVLGTVGATIGLIIGFLLGLMLRYLYIKSVKIHT